MQGKQRQDSLVKDRDIFVGTKLGKVQGFYVYLYDNPDPESLYRPGVEFIEKVQGKTRVFLGIPYAQPPVNEGRFKVFICLLYSRLLKLSLFFSHLDGIKGGRR